MVVFSPVRIVIEVENKETLYFKYIFAYMNIYTYIHIVHTYVHIVYEITGR